MGDDDSEHFESADEGLLPSYDQNNLKQSTNDDPINPQGLPALENNSPSSTKFPVRVRKKTPKKRRTATNREKLSKPKAAESFKTMGLNLAAPVLSETDKSTAPVELTVTNTDVAVDGSKNLRSAPILPSDTTGQTSLDLDQLSAVACTLFKGVGDGLNSLADAILHPLYSSRTEDSKKDDEIASTRRKRIEEEKAERKVISQAWSEVWDTTWGTNDGWEVGDDAVEASARNDDVDSTRESSPSSVNSVASQLPLENQESQNVSSGLWDWSGVSSLAQQLKTSLKSTSFHLVQEGVGVLERIGKKTMSVIEENDPGFHHTKKLLRPSSFADRPSLSEVIREAHEKNEKKKEHRNTTESPSDRSNRISFISELEALRGLVHLEALELVAERAETQLRLRFDKVAYSASTTCESQLERIWTLLQMDIDDESEVENFGLDAVSTSELHIFYPESLPKERTQQWRLFQAALTNLSSVYPGEHLIQATTSTWDAVIRSKEESNTQELFRRVIRSLAELTSATLEYLHKLAECVLVRNQGPHVDFVNLALELVMTLRCLMNLKSSLCDEYIQLIKMVNKPVDPNSLPDSRSSNISSSQLVASLLLECSNAQSYLKDAARLLVPVFQLAYVESCCLPDSL